MLQLTRDDLYSLEKYAEIRADFRQKVMTHKINRNAAIGPNLTLYFEDRLTLQYQIQEMLRVEKIFEAAGIEEELATYNALMPDGSNLKATAMLEFTDVDERRRALVTLAGIEDRIWLAFDGQEKCFAIADEDMERGDEKKTSAVHFLRFELPSESIAAAKDDTRLTIGCDHLHYQHQIQLEDPVRQSLLADLD